MSEKDEMFEMLALFYLSNIEMEHLSIAMQSCRTKPEQDEALIAFNNALEDKRIAVKYLDANRHLLTKSMIK